MINLFGHTCKITVCIWSHMQNLDVWRGWCVAGAGCGVELACLKHVNVFAFFSHFLNSRLNPSTKHVLKKSQQRAKSPTRSFQDKQTKIYE